MALKKYSQIRYGIHSTLWRVTAVTQATHKNFTHRYIATSLFYSGVAQVTDYKVTDYKVTNYKVTNYKVTNYKVTDYKVTGYKLTRYISSKGKK